MSDHDVPFVILKIKRPKISALLQNDSRFQEFQPRKLY